MNEYDAICFDAINGVAKFKNTEMISLIVETYLAELKESFKYHPMIESFDFHNNLGVCFNNAVWDIQNQTVLKVN